MKKSLLLVCVLLSSVADGKERLTVIYDSDNTFPLAPYLPEEISKTVSPPTPKTALAPFQLPITTPSMQPGKVEIEPKSLRYLQRPLFLVGGDAMSREWLSEKREQLIEIGAVGLLIEAQNMEEIREIIAIAEGIQLAPASAESFASELGLSHYPILLSKDGWEQ